MYIEINCLGMVFNITVTCTYIYEFYRRTFLDE